MLETLAQGLLITVVGMALVFLTLIVVMLVIQLLDRVFRPASGEEEASPAPVVRGEAPIAEASAESEDEAAAIAVAIALERAKLANATTQPAPAPQMMSAQAVNVFDVCDETAAPEPVTVIQILPGPGSWKSYGRVKAMQ